MMPRSLYDDTPPVRVNVFPDPVCPYAKTVPLKPSITESTTGRATVSKTSSCVASGPMSPLKPKRQRFRLLLTMPLTTSFGTSTCTTLSSPSSKNPEGRLHGRQRR